MWLCLPLRDQTIPHFDRKRQIGEAAAVQMSQLAPSDAELDAAEPVRGNTHARPSADDPFDPFADALAHRQSVARAHMTKSAMVLPRSEWRMIWGMWQPTSRQWWLLVLVAVFIVFAWPPDEDRSLAIKMVNWAVDPAGRLPVLPDPLGLAEGDDPVAVYTHDIMTQQYDALYQQGGWMRRRLELKVARDPFDASTERQVLTALGVVMAFVAWRFWARAARPGRSS